MANIQPVEEKKTFGDKFSLFLTKNRVWILGIIITLIVVAVVLAVVKVVSTEAHQKGLTELDSIVYNLTKTEETSLPAAKTEALEKITALADKNSSNIVGLRAQMAAADIYFSNENWSEARDAWLKAAAIDGKAYTASVCYYNAAVCSEELNDTDSAITYYEKALAGEYCEFDTHILFSLGRLLESKSDFAGAAEKYNELKNSYPNDSWTDLAQSRLIALQSENKIQ